MLVNKKSANFVFIILFFATLLTSTNAFSQSRGGGPSKFSAGVMVSGGSGKMGNGVDVLDRTMFYTPIGVFLGYNLKKFRMGLNYEYNIATQTDDPANFSSQNLTGKGSCLGVRLEYYDGKQSFGAIYRASDTFTLDKVTASGASSTYKSSSGYTIQYTRQIKKRIGIVIDYTSETFTESLTNNIKWDRIGLGLILTNYSSTK